MNQLREALQSIADLAERDSLGATAPVMQFSWETVARLALDYANAALALPDAQPVAWRIERNKGWSYTSVLPHKSILGLAEPLFLAPQPAIAPDTGSQS